MSGEIGKIREAIQRIAGTYQPGSVLFTAEVTAVTETDCTIKIGEMEVTGVKLFSIEEAGNLLVKPVVNTMVTVADLSGGQLRDLVVIKVDKVELVKYEQDGLIVLIDSVNKIVKVENGLTMLIDGGDSKASVSNDNASLKDLFASIADILQTLTVSTPAGPSGTPLPPTIQKITQLNTDLNNLLK